MSLFHLCPELNCNRKYKGGDKLIRHLLQDHEKIVEEKDLPAPTEINKTNKKSKENEKNNKARVEKERVTKEQVLKRKAEEEEIQQKIRQEFLEQQAEKIRKIEEDRLHLEEEKLRLEQQHVEILKKIQNRASSTEASLLCAICGDSPADTAVSPCGHACFCFSCIMTYKHTYEKQGCPVCRGPMQSIVQLFQ